MKEEKHETVVPANDAEQHISNCGYDMDYISDNFVKSTRCVNGKLLTKGHLLHQIINKAIHIDRRFLCLHIGRYQHQ